MILGLAVSCVGNPGVYDDQLLCAGAVLGACCLAPVQTKRSVAPLFEEKTRWFQHTFPLSPESGPGGLREIPDASRGLLGAPPGLSGGVPRGPSGILLPGLLLQVPSSGVPPQGILLRIPLPGFLPQDSTSGFFFQDSSSGIPALGILL